MARVDPKKQRELAEMLGRGATLLQASKAIGCHERTARRWLRENPDLRRIAQRVGDNLLDPDALQTLKDCLLATKPGGAPDFPTRRAAASDLLKLGLAAPEGAAEEHPPGTLILPPLERDL